MPEQVPNLEPITVSLEKLGDATEKVAEKHTWSARLQLLIAFFTVVVTGISILNNRSISAVDAQQKDLQIKQDELKVKQEELHKLVQEQQVEASIGTSILHETLGILDTKDPETLDKKKLVHVLMLTTLEQRTRAESDPTTAFMHNFYVGLIGIISPKSAAGSGGTQTSAPPGSPVEEATSFAASDADYRVRLTLPEAVPAAATSSPPKINASGEAVQPGPASGWDYDVFWCVRSTHPGDPSKNLDIAKVLFEGLVRRQASGKIGRVRLRRLPEVINQAAGFNVANTAIVVRRYDSASEPKEADELKRWAEEDLSSAHMDDQDSKVVIEDRAEKLRFYLTIFACTH